jgi:SAM-dependent methyltransferase
LSVISEIDFIRYLAAKKSIDDRALNRRVWDELCAALARTKQGAPIRVLEIGCGIGTMIERAVEWGLLSDGAYTAVDGDENIVAEACRRLVRWAAAGGLKLQRPAENTAEIRLENGLLSVAFLKMDVYEFFDFAKGCRQWDLGIAHAFMDLVDMAEVIPRFCAVIRPGGLLYFSLNYDGETILLPPADPHLDAQIITLYNHSMDVRMRNGRKAGDSRSGRHLFELLKNSGTNLLAAGCSDWVIFPRKRKYSVDETYFLNVMVHTIHQELKNHPALNAGAFENWIRKRRAQIESAELIFIAKQMDLLAQTSLASRPA